MKIAVISDTHELHKKLFDINLYTDIDVLIHCGDITSSKKDNKESTFAFLEWFEKLPIKHKILVPGNHDLFLEQNFINNEFELKKLFPSINILIDQELIIEDIKFFGSPWTLPFGKYSFMKKEIELKELYDSFPKDINVFISHGPAFNLLDLTYSQQRIGSTSLSNYLKELPYLKYHLFGHVHEDYGINKHSFVSINSALFTDYGNFNKPVLFEI